MFGKKKSKAKAAEKHESGKAGVFSVVTDPKTAKRTIQVARIAGPFIAPYALAAATTARGYLDNLRAERLGVSPDEVAAYRGPTGPARARIASLGHAIEDLRQRHMSDLPAVRFADVAKDRLSDLSAAATAARSMPPGRRRAALSAINRNLDQIDADLMTFLVVKAA